jgi:rSAM/selenodomain-associated transferase 2
VSITIVIPALDEASVLPSTLAAARALGDDVEIIVVDGGSRDGTVDIARRLGAVCVSAPPGRAAAMNRGAALARGETLLFLHADTRPPPDARERIGAAFTRAGVVGGCFRLSFDSPRRVLAAYAFFTRFPFRLFHYGDAGYFVRAEAFRRLGGFREYPLMEDLDLWLRMRACGRVVVVASAVVTSARRYERRGALRQQALNTALVLLFVLGVPPRRLKRFYSANVR